MCINEVCMVAVVHSLHYSITSVNLKPYASSHSSSFLLIDLKHLNNALCNLQQ